MLAWPCDKSILIKFMLMSLLADNNYEHESPHYILKLFILHVVNSGRTKTKILVLTIEDHITLHALYVRLEHYTQECNLSILISRVHNILQICMLPSMLLFLFVWLATQVWSFIRKLARQPLFLLASL